MIITMKYVMEGNTTDQNKTPYYSVNTTIYTHIIHWIVYALKLSHITSYMC